MAVAARPSDSRMERAVERNYYLDFLTKDTPWVMLVTGLEGNGKTEFLGDIRDHTPLDGTCVVLLNFAKSNLQRDALSILELLVRRMGSHCDAESIAIFKNVLRTARDKLSNENIFNVNQIRAESNTTVTGNSQGISNSEDMIAQRRQQIRSVVEDEFYSVLDSFRLAHLVIMLDNCEWINEIENTLPETIEVSKWLLDILIPGIYEQMREKNKHCSVVLASSVPPGFRNIPERSQIECNLDKLDWTVVDRYFEQVGVQEPEMRRYIYEDMTYGHARCIWIVGRMWEDHGSFTVNDLPDFQSEFKEKALHQFLHSHIFEKYPLSPFRNLIHYGALLRSFDQPLLQAVFPDWMPQTEAFRRFHRLTLYPYVVQQQNNRYAFVDLLRHLLTHCIRQHESEKWRMYQQKALNFLTETSHPDRFYHELLLNEQAGLLSWQQEVDRAYAKALQDVVTLLDIIDDKTLILTPVTRAERIYQRGRFYAYNKQYAEAVKKYEQAQVLFREIGNVSGEARMVQAIDDLRRMGLNDSGSTEAH